MNPSDRPGGARLGFRDRVAVLAALPLVAVVLAGVPLLAVQLDTVRQAEAEAGRVATAAVVRPLLGALAAERLLVLAGPAAGEEALLAAQADTVARAEGARRHPDAGPVLAAALDGLDALAAVRAGLRAGPVAAPVVDAAFDAAFDAARDALLATRAVDTVATLVAEDERRATAEVALVRAALDPARAPDAAGEAALAGVAADLHARSAGGEGAAAAVREGPAAQRVQRELRALAADPPAFAAAQAGRAPALLADVTAAAVVRGVAADRDLALAARRAAAAARAAEAAAGGLAAAFAALAVAVVALGVRNGRSVSRPLRRLASAADEVAELARAELLRVADSEDPATPAPQLAAVAVEADDELGELAGAFNRVQAVAALLLERQALVRLNSAAMLANVGRRTRSLVGRQLDLVDSLEQGEQDPGRLDRLYRLDHLTSRLRRSADSLLVLASARDEDAVLDPQPLVVVVRAALASIEDFDRVTVGAVPDVQVRPAVHADLVLLVAELLENAVSFSPPGSGVEVRVVLAAGGGHLEIVDHGVGIDPAELARHNEAFLRRERLEVAPTDVLGLVVVGRIARRHGLTVTLRATPGGGVTAVVAVPANALAGTLRSVPAPPDPREPGVDPSPDALWFVPPAPRPLRPRDPGRPAGPPRHALGTGPTAAAPPAADHLVPGLPGPGLPGPGLPGLGHPGPGRLGVVAARAMAAELDDAVAGPPAPTRSPWTESPRTEPPRTEPPRTEPPRTEIPRTELPRAEPPRPPGASGLTRRVRGAQSPVGGPAQQPLLAPPVDARSARDLVRELEAGIDRAAAARTAAYVPHRQEER